MPNDEVLMTLRHLRREARSALEIALVGLAPAQLVDGLALAAGLLEALNELPTDTPPVSATVPGIITRATQAVEAWRAWHSAHLAARTS